jgi:hypothetical protein
LAGVLRLRQPSHDIFGHVEQLGERQVARDDREQVVEIMGDTRGQNADRFGRVL